MYMSCTIWARTLLALEGRPPYTQHNASEDKLWCGTNRSSVQPHSLCRFAGFTKEVFYALPCSTLPLLCLPLWPHKCYALSWRWLSMYTPFKHLGYQQQKDWMIQAHVFIMRQTRSLNKHLNGESHGDVSIPWCALFCLACVILEKILDVYSNVGITKTWDLMIEGLAFIMRETVVTFRETYKKWSISISQQFALIYGVCVP